jgi:hypothetical protein
MPCGHPQADGSPCRRPALIFDARRHRMLCQEHAVAPLERVLGPRDDLDSKAEYALRFLALPSQNRHDILEALAPEERREFIDLVRLFDTPENL